MSRAALAVAAALAASLAGCPLPQPLSETSGGVTTPARFVVDQVTPEETRLLVGKACPPGAAFALSAPVASPDPAYPVDARWFVDYDPVTNAGVYHTNAIPISSGGANGTAQWSYGPPPYDAAQPVHVVEVVISNGFLDLGAPEARLPNRSARDGFETQVFRWVFVYDDAGGCGTSGA